MGKRGPADVLAKGLTTTKRVDTKPEPRVDRDGCKTRVAGSVPQSITLPQVFQRQYDRQVAARNANAQANANAQRRDGLVGGRHHDENAKDHRSAEHVKELRATATDVFAANAVFEAEAAAPSKIYARRKDDSTSQIELSFEEFTKFCSESLPQWLENIKVCEDVRWKLWTMDQKFAAALSERDLVGQKAEARRFEQTLQKIQSQKHRWSANSRGGPHGSHASGMVGRAVKRQILWSFIEALLS